MCETRLSSSMSVAQEETEPCQTGLRRRDESPAKRYREATVTALLLDSTQLVPESVLGTLLLKSDGRTSRSPAVSVPDNIESEQLRAAQFIIVVVAARIKNVAICKHC